MHQFLRTGCFCPTLQQGFRPSLAQPTVTHLAPHRARDPPPLIKHSATPLSGPILLGAAARNLHARKSAAFWALCCVQLHSRVEGGLTGQNNPVARGGRKGQRRDTKNPAAWALDLATPNASIDSTCPKQIASEDGAQCELAKKRLKAFR